MNKELIISTLMMSLDIYSYIIIARILMSWFPNSRGTEIGRFMIQVTDPVLLPVKRVVPPVAMIDLSPIVVIFGINLIQNILISL